MHPQKVDPRHSQPATRPSTAKGAKKPPTPGPELEQAKKALLKIDAQNSVGHWDMGEIYNSIVDGELAKKSGYASARDFFNAEVGTISQSLLSACGRVAKLFTRDVAARYSVGMLNRLLRWWKLKHQGALPVPADPGEVELEFERQDGARVRKTFAAITTRELDQAIKLLKPPPRPPQFPPLDQRVLKAMTDMLVNDLWTERFGVQLKVFAVRGEPHFHLLHVPFAKMDHLFDALYSAEWNERDSPPPVGSTRVEVKRVAGGGSGRPPPPGRERLHQASGPGRALPLR